MFFIIYLGFGIPLTLIFLKDLSYLIKQFLEYILLIFSSKSFRFIRRLFNKKQIEYDDEKENQENLLNLKEIISLLIIYILLGNYFLISKNFFDNFYICFTMLFTLNFNKQIYNENQNLFFFMVYLYCGLAIVLLYIKTVKKTIQLFLLNIGKKILRNLLDWTQQIGKRRID